MTDIVKVRWICPKCSTTHYTELTELLNYTQICKCKAEVEVNVKVQVDVLDTKIIK